MPIRYQDIQEGVASLLNAKRTNRPRKASCRGESRLMRLMKRNRGKVLKDVTNDFNVGNGVVRRTVQRILHKNRIRKRKVVKEINCRKRFAWSLQKHWLTVNQYWKNIIFSDESYVVLGQNNKVYV